MPELSRLASGVGAKGEEERHAGKQGTKRKRPRKRSNSAIVETMERVDRREGGGTRRREEAELEHEKGRETSPGATGISMERRPPHPTLDDPPPRHRVFHYHAPFPFFCVFQHRLYSPVSWRSSLSPMRWPSGGHDCANLQDSSRAASSVLLQGDYLLPQRSFMKAAIRPKVARVSPPVGPQPGGLTPWRGDGRTRGKVGPG